MSIFDKFKKSGTDKDDSAPQAAKVQPAKVSAPKEPKPRKESKPKAEKVASVSEGAKKEEAAVKAEKGHKHYDVFGILLEPLITEKAANIGVLNQYIFKVAKNANKIQISQAIEARYGVKPVSINVMNCGGKNIRYGKTLGRTKGYRKAIITLPEGKSISVYEAVNK